MKVLRKDTNVNPEMDDHELIFGDLANVFDEGAPGPSNSIIQPVSDPHIGLENGLPSLEEFCHTLPKDAIPKDAVDTVFNMLGEEGDRHFLTNLLQTTENDLPPISQMCPESTNNVDQPSGSNASTQPMEIEQEPPTYVELQPAARASSSHSEMSLSFGSVDSSSANEPGPSFGEMSNIQISTEPHMPMTPAPDSVRGPDLGCNEIEVDAAMLTVLNDFEKIAAKEAAALLDGQTLQSCLDNMRRSPILICSTCFDVFQDIAPFQLHFQICNAAPRIQFRQKMDQQAIGNLACDLWKDAFVKKLKTLPNSERLMSQEDHLRTELNQMWHNNHNDAMARCRAIFIHISVEIIARKWRETALANEIVRVNKVATLKAKKRPIKVLIDDSDDETPIAKRSQTTPGEKKPVGRKRIRPTKKAAQKKTQTDLALEGLEADQDDILSNGTPYHETQHAMPDTPASMNTADLMTPRSDRGADFPMVTIVLNPWERTGSAASTPESPTTPEEARIEPQSPTNDEKKPASPTSNGKKQPVEEEKETTSTTIAEINNNSRESSYADSDSDDCVVVAADTGEKIPKSTRKYSRFTPKIKTETVEEVDLSDDGPDDGPTSDLSDNEFIVDKIINRRLIVKVSGGIPRDEHYEYLVSWVGFTPDDNSWEPYDNLTCTVKLHEFHKRLAEKAMRGRSRGGKHM